MKYIKVDKNVIGVIVILSLNTFICCHQSLAKLSHMLFREF